jgi:putative ABC transport system permease protein
LFRATLKSVVAHKLRLALTGLAIVLGVGFVAGTFVLTDTLSRFFDDVFAEGNQAVDVEIQAAKSSTSQSAVARDSGVPESLLETVRKVPGVGLAAGRVGGYAQFMGRDGKRIGGQGPPTIGIGGADNAVELSPLRIRAGRTPNAPGEVVMDVVTAKNHHFAVGDRVRVIFVGPAEEFTIVGLSGFGKADNLGGATLAVFDLRTGQRVFDKPGRFDAISVQADQNTDPGTLLERVSSAIPAQYEAVSGQQAAADNAAQIKQGINFLGTAVLFFAGISLFVGAFVIANTFAIVVAQRTRELALLRALGATGGQILRSVVGEAALVGLVASVIGLGFGVGVGVGLRRLIQLISGGAALPGADILVLPRTVIVSLVLGVVVAVLSAIAPARRAARLSPIAAMREAPEDVTLPSLRRNLIAGIVGAVGAGMVAVGMFGRSVPQRFAWLALGTILTFLGVALLAALIARPVAATLAWPLPRVAGVAGRLARANATRNPTRTAATAVALMVGLALVTAISLLTASIKASVRSVLDDVVRTDLVVRAEGMEGRMSHEVGDRIRALPTVADAVALRPDQWHLHGKSKTLVGVTPQGIGNVMDLRMVEGSATELADGGVLVHSDVAKTLGLHAGSMLPMEFPQSGEVQVHVDGIFSERRVTNSSYLLSMADYERGYTARNDVVVLVKFKPGVVVKDAMKGLGPTLADFPNVALQNQEDFKRDQSRQFDQILALVTALLMLAIVIALLGIANTLALSIFERTRELGLLRAVGMSRRQVRRMVRWEAVLIALFGAVLGVGVGAVFGWAAVRALADDGITKTVVPFGQWIVLVVVAGLAGLVAAAFPARRAGRLDVLAAIASE